MFFQGRRGRLWHFRALLLLGTFAPVVVFLSAVSIYFQADFKPVFEKTMTHTVEQYKHLAANLLESHLTPTFSMTKYLANSENIQSIVSDLDRAGATYDFTKSPKYADLREELERSVGSLGASVMRTYIIGVKNSQYVTSDGIVSDSSYDITQKGYYKKLLSNPSSTIVADVYKDSLSGETVITVATGIVRDDELVAIIGADLPASGLAAKLDRVVIGETGFLVLYDGQGTVVYNTSGWDNVSYSQNIQDALDSKQDFAIDACTVNNTDFYGKVTQIPYYGWTMVTAMSAEEFGAISHHVLIRISIVMFSVMILLFLSSFLLSGPFVKPLRDLTRVADEMANGNLDVKIDVHSRTEVAELADSMSGIVDRLRENVAYIDEISVVLERLGECDLTPELQLDYAGEFSKLKTSLEHVKIALANTVSGMTVSAAHVADGAQGSSAIAASLSEGARQQATAVEELANSVEELSATATAGADNAANASHSLQEVGQELDSSNDKMHEMLAAMDNITKQSNEISKIVKTISDIAFQTNILALNAAVEAARAGQAGKGFAVVADEVRSLAVKSADAAETTTQLIGRTIDAIGAGADIANETAASISRVAEKTRDAVNTIDDIAESCRYQADGLTQIAAGVDQISSVVQANTAMAEESARSSEELSAQANALNNLVSKFKFDN